MRPSTWRASRDRAPSISAPTAIAAAEGRIAMTRLFFAACAALYVSLSLGVADCAAAAELTGSATVTLPDELVNAWEERVEALERRVEALEVAQEPNPDPDTTPPSSSQCPVTGRYVVHGAKV